MKFFIDIVFLFSSQVIHVHHSLYITVEVNPVNQRSLLNKLHVCGKIISGHKSPLRDGFHSNNHECEAGLDKKFDIPYCFVCFGLNFSIFLICK